MCCDLQLYLDIMCTLLVLAYKSIYVPEYILQIHWEKTYAELCPANYSYFWSPWRYFTTIFVTAIYSHSHKDTEDKVLHINKQRIYYWLYIIHRKCDILILSHWFPVMWSQRFLIEVQYWDPYSALHCTMTNNQHYINLLTHTVITSTMTRTLTN